MFVDFFARLRSGEFGLGTMVWGLGFLASIVFYAVVFPLVGYTVSLLTDSVDLVVISLFCFYGVYVGYWLFWMQGTWIAADKYDGWIGWAILAKGIVCFTGVSLFINITFLLLNVL